MLAVNVSVMACKKRPQKVVSTAQTEAQAAPSCQTGVAQVFVTGNGSVAQYVLCDSANSLLPEVKMEFLTLNSIPRTSGFDGLIRYAFPENVDSAEVMLSGQGLDTLRIVIRRTDQGKQTWIVMNVRAGQHMRNDGIYYTLGATSRTYDRSAVKSKKIVEAVADEVAFAEAEVLSVTEDAAAGYMPSSVRPEAAAVNNLQAGKLTAGEVNDFAKWHLWSRILEQSHASYISTWRMRVQERYRVQVTNAKQFPIADAEVSLLNAEGKTLFSGRTDNTGHAELWANIFTDSKDAAAAIVCAHNGLTDTILQPLLFPKENLFILDEACAAPEHVDVFFIMDATGSMGDELRYMNAELQDVISRSGSAVPGTVIRTGALVYRDHQDDYLNRLSPLTEDIRVTQAFLNAQHANGGGDYEEAVPEAMMAAVNVAGWSAHARARIAFLILDAPCHNDSATLAILHEQSLAAAKAGIRIVPVVCSGLQEAGELLMRELALLTNGTSFFLTDDSGIGDKHLKPTTDSLKVEHLNDMLVRTIIEFASMPDCDEQWADSAVVPTEEEAFLPNPFSPEDLDTVPAMLPERPLSEVITVRPNPCQDYFLADLPLGADAAYLVDITGKTLQSLGAIPSGSFGYSVNVGGYATGVYFIKVFVEGRWYAKKVIVKQ